MASKKVKKLMRDVNAGMTYYEKNRDRIQENVQHATATAQSAAQKIRTARQTAAKVKARIPVAKKKKVVVYPGRQPQY